MSRCSTSRNLNRDDGRPAISTAITAIDIAISTRPSTSGPGAQAQARPERTPPVPAGTRRHRVTAIMSTDPRRPWSGAELAAQLQVKPATS